MALVLQRLVWLALAGAVGTLARYGLAGLVHRLNGVSFPWGTVVVNVSGCFLAGLLWTVFENRWPVAGETRTLVMVGFMGAFTTFSSFILETGELVRAAEWIQAAANLALQNGVGFVALFLGMALGRMV
jgi:CrcB protein